MSALSSYIVPPAELAPSIYHGWAHKHWVWNHNGENYQDTTLKLVNDYLSHDIPVGAVDIDSMWETAFNNFQPDPARFPDMKGMIDELHDMNIRVITWATSMINVENPDYDMCVEKDYLVKNGKGVVRPLGWWHGDGALLDYSNPEAVAWWHSKMDTILDMGVDGFKTDGTDPYIAEYILFTGAALGYNNVSLTYRDYANYYYRDFFYYTREKRGDIGLIMSRPVDCQLDKAASLCTPFSPRDVMLSGWMGDDDGTFNGLRGVMRKGIYSAWDGYTNYGCDIGGYRGNDNGPDKEVFLRWAQYGAFLPLMENGGGGEHRPWMYDEQTTDIYRKFVTEHYRLIPYFMTTGMEAYESDGSVTVVRPVARRDPETPDYRLPEPSTLSYLLGPDLIVHPVATQAASKDDLYRTGSEVRMTFPSEGALGEESRWFSWFAPSDKSQAVSIPGGVEGGEVSLIRYVPLDSMAVYVRQNALIPLHASATDETVLFTWFNPIADSEKSADVREPASAGPGLVGTISLSADGAMTGSISAHSSKAHGGFGWVVVGITEPESVTFKAAGDATSCSYSYEEASVTLTATCSDNSEGMLLQAFGVKVA